MLFALFKLLQNEVFYYWYKNSYIWALWQGLVTGKGLELVSVRRQQKLAPYQTKPVTDSS